MSPNAVDRFERLNGDAVSGEVTQSTFEIMSDMIRSTITSTPVIPDHSLLSVTNLVNVATFTHCIAWLFTAIIYNKI